MRWPAAAGASECNTSLHAPPSFWPAAAPRSAAVGHGTTHPDRCADLPAFAACSVAQRSAGQVRRVVRGAAAASEVCKHHAAARRRLLHNARRMPRRAPRRRAHLTWRVARTRAPRPRRRTAAPPRPPSRACSAAMRTCLGSHRSSALFRPRDGRLPRRRLRKGPPTCWRLQHAQGQRLLCCAPHAAAAPTLPARAAGPRPVPRQRRAASLRSGEGRQGRSMMLHALRLGCCVCS